MTRVSTQRVIGAVSAKCDDCDWTWSPRETTTAEGSQGARNAVSAIQWHGRTQQHRITITRATHYDFRAVARGDL